MSESGDVRQRVGFAVAWVVAAVVAITVGVVAVSGVGDRIRDRGPLGNNELVRSAGLETGKVSLDLDEPLVVETIQDDFGEFDVACRGRYAKGLEARPDEAAGWRIISYERTWDDDADAVFSNGRRSQELEVYCNLGRPVNEIEDLELPAED